MSFFSALWHKYLGGKSTPWADVRYRDGQMQVVNFNKAFADSLRSKFGDLTDGKDDSGVVRLFADRENVELEEPRLDVKHSGITDDGRIKMQLDWNQAFIRHLADNGIIAETEEEAVQMYLSLLTNKVGEDLAPDVLSREGILGEAFRDIEDETAAELAEAARQIEEQAKAIKVGKRKAPRRRSKLEMPPPSASNNPGF